MAQHLQQVQRLDQTLGLDQPQRVFSTVMDTMNPFRHSQFFWLFDQFCHIGIVHPDDKKKAAQQFYDEQMAQLAAEFRNKEAHLANRHYPGQLSIPRQTSAEYKREHKIIKQEFEQKQKHFEELKDTLLKIVSLGEQHAFLCEVPGWNNQSYIDTVDIMRRAEPIASPSRSSSGGGGSSGGGAAARISGSPVINQLTDRISHVMDIDSD